MVHVQLENAWVFSGEEGVAETVKAYLALEKKLLSYLTPEKRKTAKPTDISGLPLDFPRTHMTARLLGCMCCRSITCPHGR